MAKKLKGKIAINTIGAIVEVAVTGKDYSARVEYTCMEAMRLLADMKMQIKASKHKILTLEFDEGEYVVCLDKIGTSEFIDGLQEAINAATILN